jgi:ribosomal-protein-serine acetyltransferase
MPWAYLEPSPLDDRIALIRKWRADRRAGGDSVLGIFREGAVVGSTGLHRRDRPDTVEIGYWIHVDHLRRGYATEVAKALTEAAFGTPDIDRVEIRHDEANTASAGIPRKLGFTRTGVQTVDKAAPAWTGELVIWVKERS